MSEEFSLAVREKAAEYANAHAVDPYWTAGTIADCHQLGHALCWAVQDGALHMDPVELDRARWEEACRQTDRSGTYPEIVGTHRRLVREGWLPPEPVDPVEQVAREVDDDNWVGVTRSLRASLGKLGLKIVKDGQ